MIFISEAELVAVAKRVAQPDTERRVLAAALHDPEIQRRLVHLQQPSPPSDITDVLRRATQAVAREYAQAKAPWWQPFVGQLRQKLVLTPKPLRLPLLAPALAASVETLLVQREVFEQEGVHVELHQLPGTPPRLRSLVDASQCTGTGINTVALAFQEASGEPFVVLVPLNAQKRGLREWEVGRSGERGFPAPAHPLSLIEIALLERP